MYRNNIYIAGVWLKSRLELIIYSDILLSPYYLGEIILVM